MGQKFPQITSEFIESHDCQANGHCGLYQVEILIHHKFEKIIYIRKMTYLGLLCHGRHDSDEGSKSNVGNLHYIVGIRNKEDFYLLSDDMMMLDDVFITEEFEKLASLKPTEQVHSYWTGNEELEDDEKLEVQKQIQEIFIGWNIECAERILDLTNEKELVPLKGIIKYRYNPSYWCERNGTLKRGMNIGSESHQWYKHFLGEEIPLRVTRGIEHI